MADLESTVEGSTKSMSSPTEPDSTSSTTLSKLEFSWKPNFKAGLGVEFGPGSPAGMRRGRWLRIVSSFVALQFSLPHQQPDFPSVSGKSNYKSLNRKSACDVGGHATRRPTPSQVFVPFISCTFFYLTSTLISQCLGRPLSRRVIVRTGPLLQGIGDLCSSGTRPHGVLTANATNELL